MTKTITYFRNLDALRFYAVAAVFLYHYYHIQGIASDNIVIASFIHIFSRAGYLGVDFFFTLSGFLITSILISQGSFDLGRFYIRRALRIVPLYLLITAVCYLVVCLGLYTVSLPPVGYVLTFTANHFYERHGDSYLFAITILWSLSVEMQFYFVWGTLMRFAKRHLYSISGILIIVSLVAKYLLYGKCSLYYLSATYVPDFMIGAVAARVVYDKIFDPATISKGVKVVLYILAAGFFVATPYLSQFFWWRIFDDCVYAALASSIIADQCSVSSLFEAGKSKLLNYLGKVSYGIYCFQGFVLPLYSKFLLSLCLGLGVLANVFVVPVVLFAVTALAASLSYRYFEGYFLRLKAQAGD